MSDMTISAGEGLPVDPTLDVQKEGNDSCHSKRDDVHASNLQSRIGDEIRARTGTRASDFYLANMGVPPTRSRPVARGDAPTAVIGPHVKRMEQMAQTMLEEQNQAIKKINETLTNHPKKAVHNERVTLIDLEMQASANKRPGNKIRVKPGERIIAKVLYVYDTTKMNNPSSFNPNSLNQIIVGFEGEGAKACLFHGFAPKNGQVKGEKIFTFHAPEKPGEYDMRFRYAQAYNPHDAVKDWWGVDGTPPETASIGKVIVKA